MKFSTYIKFFVLLCSFANSVYSMQKEDSNNPCCSEITLRIKRKIAETITHAPSPGFQLRYDESSSDEKPVRQLKMKESINWDWQKKCKSINRSDPKASALHKEQLEDELDAFMNAMNNSSLSDAALWVDKKPSQEFYDQKKLNYFYPFVQKLEVESGSEISFHGDLHGDIHSLNGYLIALAEDGYTDTRDPFKIIKNKFYMIFLGDYTDRGKYGAEVIYTILRLKRTNPDNVFLVRGNHEDIFMNTRDGFSQELINKFGSDEILKKINRMYNYMPVALYLVSGKSPKSAILCCHGGPERGFNNSKLLLSSSGAIRYISLSELTRKTNLENVPNNLSYVKNFADNHNFTPKDAMSPFSIDFMWADFDVKNISSSFNPTRGVEYDQPFTNFLLAQQSIPECNVEGVFRAHQHGDPAMMNIIINKDGTSNSLNKGVCKLWCPHESFKNSIKLWNGIVCTFSVCPNTPYGDAIPELNFDTFGILKTADTFKDWTLKIYRIKFRKK